MFLLSILNTDIFAFPQIHFLFSFCDWNIKCNLDIITRKDRAGLFCDIKHLAQEEESMKGKGFPSLGTEKDILDLYHSRFSNFV